MPLTRLGHASDASDTPQTRFGCLRHAKDTLRMPSTRSGRASNTRGLDSVGREGVEGAALRGCALHLAARAERVTCAERVAHAWYTPRSLCTPAHSPCCAQHTENAPSIHGTRMAHVARVSHAGQVAHMEPALHTLNTHAHTCRLPVLHTRSTLHARTEHTYSMYPARVTCCV